MTSSNFIEVDHKQLIVESTLSIGCFDSNNFFISGTAVVIAPNLAITVKHVIHDLIKRFKNFDIELATSGGESNSVQENINIVTAQYTVTGDKMYVWRVYEIYICLQSDIAFLYLQSFNEESKNYNWKKCILELNPPNIGDEVFGFGFYNSEAKLSKSPGITKLNWDNSAATTLGIVTAYFPVKRDDSRLNFPCFQTDARFDGGMSGGPIFDTHGHLIGLICSSLPATDEFPEHISYAALIWPSMITQIKIPYVELKENMPYPLLFLAKTGAISALGWEKVILQNVRGLDWYDTVGFKE